MEIFRDTPGLRSYLKSVRKRNLKLGLVPTMGALHTGHIALIDSSLKDCDLTVCSIFVNPLQFNNPEDYAKYPKALETDLKMLEQSGCHVVFVPEVQDLYSDSRVVNFKFGYLETTMEGEFRPGHFNGVGLIVLKLFNIVQPDNAYFGKKDLQQYVIIQKMTDELSLDINIIGVDTVRDENGLALSSRNQRLSDAEKNEALIFYRSLCRAKDRLLNDVSVKEIKSEISEVFRKPGNTKLEYLEIVHSDTLRPVKNKFEKTNVSICIAGYVGKVRLIDNISII